MKMFNIIREDFLCFVIVNDVTGEGLSNLILNSLQKLSINFENMAGQW